MASGGHFHVLAIRGRIGSIGWLACLSALLLGCGSSVSTGDPGGHIIDNLLTIRHAVPPGSSQVRVLGVQEPTWISTCSDQYLHVGWSVAQAQMSFVSSKSPQSVRQYVDNHLAAQRWRLNPDVATGQWFGPAGSSTRVVMNNYVEYGKRENGTGSQATLTVNWGTPVNGYTVGQPVTWILVTSSPPVPPIGSCSGG
jgi:hypothetical protein